MGCQHSERRFLGWNADLTCNFLGQQAGPAEQSRDVAMYLGIALAERAR
jgi:hypothetical protein